MAEIKLRNWQSSAIQKSLDWYKNNKNFILNAAPGSGKTICASVIASRLIQMGEIKRVIVIAPRTEVVRQWSEEFEFVTGRHMSKVTGSDLEIHDYGVDLCATWQAVENLSEGFKRVCNESPTLVICDEHHHAAVTAAWGKGADNAFDNAKHALILTGTPIRSDGEETIWMEFDKDGQISQDVDGIFTLSYGEAVDLGYCRPATFHRHEGNFKVSIDKDTSIDVSGTNEIKIPEKLKEIRGLSRALDFFKLARTPKYRTDGLTPDTESYQGTMLKWGINKLNELRYTLPNAGGLVIAPNIALAEYMADIIEILEGEKPVVVHNKIANPEQRIAAFRNTNKKWIVSVAMISEGVDIKRLRVLVYLPYATTELAFRQSLGRVVRSMGHDDMSSAYVVMPTLKKLEDYARKVENEMGPAHRKGSGQPKFKVCPSCENKCSLGATECNECGHEFPENKPNEFECDNCKTLNPVGAESCYNCGHKFSSSFTVELRDALRMGAIIKGMDLDEEEVKVGEQIGESVMKDILGSGDENLIKLISKIPPEAFGRLQKIIDRNSI